MDVTYRRDQEAKQHTGLASEMFLKPNVVPTLHHPALQAASIRTEHLRRETLLGAHEILPLCHSSVLFNWKRFADVHKIRFFTTLSQYGSTFLNSFDMP